MSSKTTGAASAAPTLTELADGIRADLAGIEGDNRAALTKAIDAGEKLNQAKEQLEHGEWLPWLDANFALTDRMARNYMALAANRKRVSGLTSIREALGALPKKPRVETPKDQQRKYRNNLWEDDDVIVWVARRMRAGRTRDEIEAESKAGTHEWPLPGRWLPRNTVDICRHIIGDRRRRGDNSRPRKKESNKRLRQLYDSRRSGERGDTDIWKLQRAIWQAASEVEWFLLPNLNWDEDTQDTVQQILDDLRRLDLWTQGAIGATIARMDDLGKQRTIHKLRVAANDQTATQGERENAVRMLAKLQRKHAMTG
jgi:hypothetical protein